MKFAIFSFVLLGSFLLSGCSQSGWLGFYYPGGALTSPIYSPELKSKEECIKWGEAMIKSRPQDQSLQPQDLYECGRDCKRMIEDDPYSTRVCQQNFDGGDWRRGDYGD